MTGPPTARQLDDRFCPNTGAPVRLGTVWPPRLVLHDLLRRAERGRRELIASVFVRHHLRESPEVIVRAGATQAEDPTGQVVRGLELGRSARTVVAGGGWQRMPIALTWTGELEERLRRVPWVRLELIIELKRDADARAFRWYAYLTGGPPRLSGAASRYDDHPHYAWSGGGGPDGGAERWIELPAPMSSPALEPACWVQPSPAVAAAPGPAQTALAPVFPLEPAVALGVEVVGWNGALGGHDRRPLVLPLGVRSTSAARAWQTSLPYWDAAASAGDAPIRQAAPVQLEPPTPCTWPQIHAAQPDPIELFQLREPSDRGREVLLDLRVRLPDDAEPLHVERAELRIGAVKVGRWIGPRELHAGRTWTLACRLDQDRVARLGEDRLRLSLTFVGRPTRGVAGASMSFELRGGYELRVHRVRYQERGQRPWLVLDLGTEGTCAAVAYYDGFAPRVATVRFTDGPIHPTRAYLAAGRGGGWALTDAPDEDAIYTSDVKLGLRLGDDAHPGCPDHISALEVGRHYLRRFLLELRERLAWFPLEAADVLVTFPPRLGVLPRFRSSLRDIVEDVVPEVLWPSGRQGRVRYREEGLMVAMPSVYRDLQLSPLAPGARRYYWVMDFGGGTTDLCGFTCTADAYGEEFRVGDLSYPQRLDGHLSGNDITQAFYRVLRRELAACGVVAGPGPGRPRRFVFPELAFPSGRVNPTALLNQTTLCELAALLKCASPSAGRGPSVLDLAKHLPSAMVRSHDQRTTTLVALLADDAAALGRRAVSELHGLVLHGEVRAAPVDSPGEAGAGVAAVRCIHCGEPHELPLWVFVGERPFRFVCSVCRAGQVARLRDGDLRLEAEEGTLAVLAGHPVADARRLLLKQDHQNYPVDGWTTLRRWVQERRVGPEDRISEGGVSWQRLDECPELADLFDVSLDEPRVGESSRPFAAEPLEPLAGRLDRFVTSAWAALDAALAALGDDDEPEVVVLLSGRASQFGPLLERLRAAPRGRVVHLTNAWVRRAYGDTGAIDGRAGLKTLTVNGGGLFALHQGSHDAAQLVVSIHSERVRCPTFLDTGDPSPWHLTEALDLRDGSVVDRVAEAPRSPLEAPTLPDGHPLVGELSLVIEGIDEDADRCPWVPIARGRLARAADGPARVVPETALRTVGDGFVLGPLADGRELRLRNLLVPLPLLGEDEG